MELSHDLGFGGKVHGRIGLVPTAEHAQTLKFLALDIDPFGRKFAAAFTELGLGHIFLAAALIAELLFDLPLDGQAMAVPTGHIVDIIAHQET